MTEIINSIKNIAIEISEAIKTKDTGGDKTTMEFTKEIISRL